MRLARNQLDVLGLLAEVNYELAGVQVADAIGGLRRSSAYAALAALQRDGMVSARWDVTGPRPLRMFKITAVGQQALAADRSITRVSYGKLSPQGT
jgi:DNA-binding PadR family transcriptional regulator